MVAFWKRAQHDDGSAKQGNVVQESPVQGNLAQKNLEKLVQEYPARENLAQENHVQEKLVNDAAAGEIPADIVPPRAENGDVGPRQPQARDAQLKWNDAKMTTSFANVVNIQSTREQVDLFFGTNQTWNIASERTLSIELNNRIILSPFAAKRLSVALAGVLREYETRYGAFDVER
jgi:Protein of unknown function (DUF3467)